MYLLIYLQMNYQYQQISRMLHYHHIQQVPLPENLTFKIINFDHTTNQTDFKVLTKELPV